MTVGESNLLCCTIVPTIMKVRLSAHVEEVVLFTQIYTYRGKSKDPDLLLVLLLFSNTT
jgi:hypothetical protein